MNKASARWAGTAAGGHWVFRAWGFFRWWHREGWPKRGSRSRLLWGRDEQDGQLQPGPWEVSGRPGSGWRTTHGEVAHWGTQLCQAAAFGSSVLVTLTWWGGHLGEWAAIWGASKSFWISSQSAYVLQLQQFGSGLLSSVSMAHFSGACQGALGAKGR